VERKGKKNLRKGTRSGSLQPGEFFKPYGCYVERGVLYIGYRRTGPDEEGELE